MAHVLPLHLQSVHGDIVTTRRYTQSVDGLIEIQFSEVCGTFDAGHRILVSRDRIDDTLRTPNWFVTTHAEWKTVLDRHIAFLRTQENAEPEIVFPVYRRNRVFNTVMAVTRRNGGILVRVLTRDGRDMRVREELPLSAVQELLRQDVWLPATIEDWRTPFKAWCRNSTVDGEPVQ